MMNDEHITDDAPTAATDSTPVNGSLTKKALIGVAGGTVTAAGVAMLFLPGPGIATIIGGLAILGTEFPAARRSLDRIKNRIRPNNSEAQG